MFQAKAIINAIELSIKCYINIKSMEANKCKVCIYVGRTWSRRRTFVKLCDFHQNVMICLRAFIMLNRNVACMEGKRDGESGVGGNREGLRVFEENLGEDGGGFCFLGASRQKT